MKQKKKGSAGKRGLSRASLLPPSRRKGETMNFRGHFFAGIIAFFVLYQFVSLPSSLYALALSVTVFFALLPDIDCDISKINDYIEIFLLLFAAYCFYVFSQSSSYGHFYLGITALGILLFTKFLKHRGWMHTVKAGVLLSLPLYFVSPLLFWFGLGGFLSHLLVDRKLF